MYVHQKQDSLSVNISPPVSHYIVYHNVTSDGDQGIIVYDASFTINVTNNALKANVVYSIQVVALNVVGQGLVSETTLRNYFGEVLRLFNYHLLNDNIL